MYVFSSYSILRIKQISKSPAPTPPLWYQAWHSLWVSPGTIYIHFSVLPRKSVWQILCVSFSGAEAYFKSHWLFYLQTNHMHYGHLYFEAEVVVLRRKISCVYETSPDGKTIVGKGIWILSSCRGERGRKREREKSHGHHLPPQTTDIRLEGFVDINLEIVHLGLRTL